MNYGLYLSASGVLTNQYRQDVFANNLANVETTGFKVDIPTVRQRDAESVEDGLGMDVSQRLLDRLGGGVLAGPQRVSFRPGALTKTDGPLDVALSDDQSFFAVGQVDHKTGEVVPRLTRDGRFTRNAQGELVTQSGDRVLDANDNPIQIPEDAVVTINRNGVLVTDAGEEVGQIQVASVDDRSRLVKQGSNLFGFTGADPREVVDAPLVHAGFIESSGVDPIQAILGVTNAGKAATANADMMKYFDRLMDQTVNDFGRVS